MRTTMSACPRRSWSLTAFPLVQRSESDFIERCVFRYVSTCFLFDLPRQNDAELCCHFEKGWFWDLKCAQFDKKSEFGACQVCPGRQLLFEKVCFLSPIIVVHSFAWPDSNVFDDNLYIWGRLPNESEMGKSSWTKTSASSNIISFLGTRSFFMCSMCCRIRIPEYYWSGYLSESRPMRAMPILIRNH